MSSIGSSSLDLKPAKPCTMGGGQIHCIRLTTRTIPPKHPTRPLPGTPPSTLSPFNKNYHCPLCPACRNDCKPLKAVLSSQGLRQLNAQLRKMEKVGVVFIASTRILQDMYYQYIHLQHSVVVEILFWNLWRPLSLKRR